MNIQTKATIEALKFGFWGWAKLYNDYKENKHRRKNARRNARLVNIITK